MENNASLPMEHSCGAVIFTLQDNQPKYLLVTNRHGQYGFPKGHMEAGETELDTATREIREEVGLTVRFTGDLLGEEIYEVKKKPGVTKLVTYFLAEAASTAIVRQQEELTSAAFYAYEDALPLFDRAERVTLLKKAHAMVMGRI